VQAASFRLSTEKIFTPLVTLAILIQQNPDLQQMRKTFPEIASKLMDEVRQSPREQLGRVVMGTCRKGSSRAGRLVRVDIQVCRKGSSGAERLNSWALDMQESQQHRQQHQWQQQGWRRLRSSSDGLNNSYDCYDAAAQAEEKSVQLHQRTAVALLVCRQCSAGSVVQLTSVGSPVCCGAAEAAWADASGEHDCDDV
jgi:hypothetical protein